MNRSLMSNSQDRLHTPASKHSRKSSSVMLKHNSSQNQMTSLRARNKSSLDQHDSSLPKEENCVFPIFSTVDDSPYVVCVPPTATSQVGFNSRTLRTHLMTAEDLSCFNTEQQYCQLYNFDRVINDCYSKGNTVNKLYSKIVKHKLQEQWP